MARFGGITGSEGWENSLEIVKLAKFAVDDYNKKQNTLLEFKKVLDVKEQVVSGTMYYITMEVKDGDETKVYEAKIWVKPWEDFKEVQEFKLVGDAKTQIGKNVEHSIAMAGVPGGIIDRGSCENSLEMEKLAKFAVDDYNKKQNTLLEFLKVLNVKEQLVAGMLYYITLEVKNGHKKQVYEAKIWEKRWEDFKQVEEFKFVRDA